MAEAFLGEWKEGAMARLWGWDLPCLQFFAGFQSHLEAFWEPSDQFLQLYFSFFHLLSFEKYHDNLLGLAWELLTKGLILPWEWKRCSFSGCVSVRFIEGNTEWCSSGWQLQKSPDFSEILIVYLCVLDGVVMSLLESWNPCFFLARVSNKCYITFDKSIWECFIKLWGDFFFLKGNAFRNGIISVFAVTAISLQH